MQILPIPSPPFLSDTKSNKIQGGTVLKNKLLIISVLSITSPALAGGYFDIGLGVSTESLESSNSVVTNSSSTLSPDIDMTAGFSIGGVFVGGKYFSYKESKAAGQEFELYSLKSEQQGTTKGTGISVGLVRNGFSLLYTKIMGASQSAQLKTVRHSDFDPTVNATASSNIELKEGDGFQVDFFYGFSLGPNVYFGPKLTYSKLSYGTYSVDNEEVADFISLSQSKFTPKLGIVSAF